MFFFILSKFQKNRILDVNKINDSHGALYCMSVETTFMSKCKRTSNADTGIWYVFKRKRVQENSPPPVSFYLRA